MDKRESFLLILIASFFMLLMYVAAFAMDNPQPVNQPTIARRAANVFGKEVEVILTGDVMLGRSVLIKTEKENDWLYPFRKVVDYLQGADVVFSNLESPIVDNCPRIDSGMTFCTDAKMIEGLKAANIGVVTVANNHAGNHGTKGMSDTKEFLTERGIDYTGAGNLVIKEIRGTRFGFLGFDFVGATLTEADLTLVKESDLLVDVLIVGVHWGEEYKDKANEKQRQTARKLVENGADVVAGHHPHWVQNIEYVNEKPVYYSLGNFVFDQMWSEETKKGLIVKLVFRNGELTREEKLPVYMSSLGQPEFKE